MGHAINFFIGYGDFFHITSPILALKSKFNEIWLYLYEKKFKLIFHQKVCDTFY